MNTNKGEGNMNTYRISFTRFIIAIGVTICGITTAQAATQYFAYDASRATWNTSSLYWGAAPGGPYDTAWGNTTTSDAVFEGATGAVSIAAGGVTAHNLSFNTNGYTITANTLTLGGTTPTITLGANINAAIGSAIVGTQGMIKEGTGNLTLTGANTYSGNTTVNAGTLTLGGAGKLYNGGTHTATITIPSNTQFLVSSSTGNALGYGVSAIWSIAGTMNRTATGSQCSLPGNVILNNGTLTGVVDATWGTFYNGTSAITITANGANNTISAGNIAMYLSNWVFTFATPSATDALFVSSVLGVSGGSYALSPLTKSGAGTVTLTGANLYIGSTTVSGGTLNLGGGTANGSLASTNLILSGGTLAYTRTGNTTQSFTNTTVSAASAVSVVSGDTLNLGTVSCTGGTIDFSINGGTVAALTASNVGVGGVIPRATFGSTWAVANGANVAISGLADGSYTLTSVAQNVPASYASAIISVDSSQAPSAGITPYSLRFNSAAAPYTLTLTGNNPVGSGSILVTSAVGANLSTITGGTLQGSASGDLTVIQNNTSTNLTIGSVIANNGGATGFIKSGPGTLILTNNNTFTGLLTLNAGTLKATGGVGSFGGAGGTGYALNGGTLWLAESAATTYTRNGSVTMGGNVTFISDKGTLSSGVLYTFPGLIIGPNKLSLVKGGNVTTVNPNYTSGTGVKFNAVTLPTGGGAILDVGTDTVLTIYQLSIPLNTTLTKQGEGVLNLNAGMLPASGNRTLSVTAGILTSDSTVFTAGHKVSLSGTARIDLTKANTGGATARGLYDVSTANGGSGIVAGTFLRYSTAQTAAGSTNGPGTIFGTVELNVNNVNPNYTLDFGAGSTLTTLGSYTFTPTSPATGITLSGDASIDASLGTFTGTGMTVSSSNSSTNTLTLTGTNTGANTISGVISNGIGTIAVQKTGTGTWTLSGTNTYTGSTTISNGTLTLANTSEARFRIQNNNVSTRVLGTGTVNLNGILRLDITGLTGSGTWNLIDVTALTETFGANFGLKFTDNSAFTNQGGGVYKSGRWTFTTADGNLTLPAAGTLIRFM
ncbi:MAG: autotransporter-associated beta strand repeat-containing protein [bacterium]